jgi:hypothetical protein
MSVRLLAFNINGIPIGDSFSIEDLNGNQPYIISETIIDGYSDITSIENWHKYGENATRDYQELQKAIRLEFYKKGWDNCNHPEKDLVIKYYANPDLGQGLQTQQVVVHLMMYHGMTQDMAVGYMIECWIKHWEKNRECCKSRWVDVARVVLRYLNFHDATDLDTSLFQLKLAYLDSNLQGIGYGDSTPGIMNFVNSDSIFVNNGLAEKNYTLQTGTIQQFRNDLEDIIIDKYFWDEIKTYLI